MRQYEAVIQAMRESGGLATLGHLYEQVLKIPGAEWKTKTPFASIRRIVQDPRFFFKIKPGLWALREYKDKLPPHLTTLPKQTLKESQFNHAYYQGLIVEIGNLKGFDTYVPAQDKNKLYVNRTLGSVAQLARIYEFTYSGIVKRARTIDVIWFNDRKFPAALFEVEHSSDIVNSLSKFYELQDFHARFYVVSPAARKREFDQKIDSRIFKDIKGRVSFLDYDFIAKFHSRTYEMSLLTSKVQL